MSAASALQPANAATMRDAFDRAFAEPIPGSPPPLADFIAIRLGDDLHALRIPEIDGLRSGVAIVPVPSPIPELMGIAGFRGTLVPVYDLPALLGYPAASGRWLALVGDRSVAFAFDHFEEHFRIDASAATEAVSARGHFVHVVARSGEQVWPVIDLPALVAALRQRAASFIPKKE